MPAAVPTSSPSPVTIPPVTVAEGVVVGGEKPVIIAGPCVIESEAHTLKMARHVKKIAKAQGVPAIFKASFDKANRSSHTSFRGHGLAEGLRILRLVREDTGLPVTTDIHESEQAAEIAASVDLIQVPALLCRQSDLIEACAATGKAVSIKKGQFLAPWDCGNIVAKFRAAPAPAGAAAHRLILIERGTSFGYNTLVTDFRALPIMRSFGVPVIFDATHSVQMPGGLGTKSGGQGHYAPMLMRAAMAVGVEGIFMETHDDPKNALSDGPNVVPGDRLNEVIGAIMALHGLLGRPAPPQPW